MDTAYIVYLKAEMYQKDMAHILKFRLGCL